jgi:hypothetical protein
MDNFQFDIYFIQLNNHIMHVNLLTKLIQLIIHFIFFFNNEKYTKAL